MTEQAKHTPGPWVVSDTNKRVVLACGTGAARVAKALDEFDDNPGGPKAFSEDYANARLIAAAPDLATSVKYLIECLEEAHAADVVCNHGGDRSEDCSYCAAIAEGKAALAKVEG